MAVYCQSLGADEKPKLEELAKGLDQELARRAQIVLLSARGAGVYEIGSTVRFHPINVRKWIHRFDRFGLRGLSSRRSAGRPRLFSRQQREAIVSLATTDPRALGLEFDSWSLRRLRSQLIQRGVVNDISVETIRQQLLRSGLVFDERRWISAP